LFIAGNFQDRHCPIEKRGIGVRVLQQFTARVAQKEFRVFLIGEAVGGDMIGSKGDSFLQCEFPLLDGLTWQSEHEIDIDVRESGSAQDMERLLGLL